MFSFRRWMRRRKLKINAERSMDLYRRFTDISYNGSLCLTVYQKIRVQLPVYPPLRRKTQKNRIFSGDCGELVNPADCKSAAAG